MWLAVVGGCNDTSCCIGELGDNVDYRLMRRYGCRLSDAGLCSYIYNKKIVPIALTGREVVLHFW